MKLNIDFTLIITILVLVQLYILNIKVKSEEDSEKLLETEKIKSQEVVKSIDNDVVVLVVHRVNGEEKTYSRKTVA